MHILGHASGASELVGTDGRYVDAFSNWSFMCPGCVSHDITGSELALQT